MVVTTGLGHPFSVQVTVTVTQGTVITSVVVAIGQLPLLLQFLVSVTVIVTGLVTLPIASSGTLVTFPS